MKEIYLVYPRIFLKRWKRQKYLRQRLEADPPPRNHHPPKEDKILLYLLMLRDRNDVLPILRTRTRAITAARTSFSRLSTKCSQLRFRGCACLGLATSSCNKRTACWCTARLRGRRSLPRPTPTFWSGRAPWWSRFCLKITIRFSLEVL